MRPKSDDRIPAYALVFDQFEIVRASLDFLTRLHERFELVVIENPSPATPEIRAFVDGYGKSGLVDRYYLFEDNISGEAFRHVLEAERSVLERSRFVLLTDADLTCSDERWLDEEVAILTRNEAVFACAVGLDMANLPVRTFPDAVTWVPPDLPGQIDYYEGLTGAHLLLLAGSDLLEFLTWRKQHGVPFVDGSMHKFCYEQLHRQWARTKLAKACHLTWDLYHDLEHPYTKMKTAKTFEDTWHHQRSAGYTLTRY